MGLSARDNQLIARLDYGEAEIHAYKDLDGKGLLNPRLRSASSSDRKCPSANSSKHTVRRAVLPNNGSHSDSSTTRPGHRRGILFSFFNHGEDLAIAAALESATYPISELLYDLGIRAGHRFNTLALAGRLSRCCARTVTRSLPGYLRRGLPEDYGEASEVLYNLETNKRHLDAYLQEELSYGDIERPHRMAQSSGAYRNRSGL